jgi:hypothetical protein
MKTELNKLQNIKREILEGYSVMETLSQATEHKMSGKPSK